jgi:heme exporter protein A
MLEATDLECVRGDRILFSGLSFSLQRGEILQVNGPNGSGKTTLLRALCGLFTPTHGEIRWRDRKVKALGEEYLSELAYLGHLNGIKDDLTAVENLLINSALAGKSVSADAARGALARMGLDHCDDLPTKLLSQGQKRRVALTRLLTAGAALWVLDEPYTALDSAAVQLLQGIIRDHVAGGGMAVMTTHQEVTVDHVPVRHIHLAA